MRASLLALVMALLAAADGSAGELITNSQARRHGLVREWFSQARLDPARHTIGSVMLKDDRLFVLTTAGAVQSFDANTGEVMWTVRVGNPAYPSFGPSASKTHVALVNGGQVYVLDRETGAEVLKRTTASGIAAAPALSSTHVFVPQFTGRVDAFSLEQDLPVPWFFTSAGRIFEDAVASPSSIIWSTDRGYLYVGNPDGAGLRFRFESTQPIVAPATTHSGSIFAASLDGYVYSLDEKNGAQRWRYACGAPVSESPVALGGALLVASDEPALHCLDADTGRPKWVAQGVAQFVSASPTSVYGLDRLGNLLVLGRDHGIVKSRAMTAGAYRAVLNEQTDRLYLITDTGLLQCLHEVGIDEPLLHDPKTEEPSEAEPEAPADEPATMADEPETTEPEPEPEVEPSDETPDPFGGADPFGGGGVDPFGGGGADPFGGSDDDPFGE